MRLGALLGPVTGNSPPDFLAEQARTYANAGFDSLWSAQALGAASHRGLDPPAK